MTVTSNILFPGLSGAPGAAQSPANAGGSGTLLDLITQLMGTTAAAPAGTEAPQLPAKLAALLKNQPGQGQETGKNDQLQALIQKFMAQQAGAAPTAVPGQTQQNLAPQLLQMIRQDATDATAPSISDASRDTQLQTLLHLLKPQAETPLLTPATRSDGQLQAMLKKIGEEAGDEPALPLTAAGNRDRQIQGLLKLLQPQNAPASGTGEKAADVPEAKTDATQDLAAQIQALAQPQDGAAPGAARHDIQALLKLLQPQQAGTETSPALKDVLALLQQAAPQQPAAGQIAAAPAAKAELLKKIAALLQPPQEKTAQDKTGQAKTMQAALTSDLSSDSAPLVQSMPAELQKKLGALLASAGSDAKTDEKIVRLLNLLEPPQAGTPPVADTGLLVQLQAKMNDPAVPFTRDDAVRFLKDKGLEPAAVQKYMTALDVLAAAPQARPAETVPGGIAADAKTPLPAAAAQQTVPQAQDAAPVHAAGRKGQIQALLRLLRQEPQDADAASVPPQDEKLKALIQLLQPQDAVPAPAHGAAAPETLPPQDRTAREDNQIQALLALLEPQQATGAETPPPSPVSSTAPQKAAVRAPLSAALPADSAALVQSLPAGLQKKLGDLLASAGSDRKTDIRITQVLHILVPRQPDAPQPVEPKLLAELRAKTSGPAAPFTRDDAAQFLKDKGLDDAAIEKYMAALDRPETFPAKAAMPQVAAKTDMPLAEEKTGAPQVSAKTDQPQVAAKTDMPEMSAKIDTPPPATTAQPAAPQPQPPRAPQHAPEAAPQAPKAPQQAAAQPSAPQPKTADTAQHISYINSLAHDSSLDAGTDGGSGQDQPGAQLFGQATPQAQAFAGIGAAAPGFASYMSAANGGAASPVTQTVAVQMQANALSKVDVMTLQLEPANLGRLSIRMKFDRDGGIKAHLTADRPETLALLRSDSTHLQRALQQAGFDADDSSLSFDLRQHDGQHPGANGAQDDARGGKPGYAAKDNIDSAPLQAQLAAQAYGYVSQGGVNIMV